MLDHVWLLAIPAWFALDLCLLIKALLERRGEAFIAPLHRVPEAALRGHEPQDELAQSGSLDARALIPDLCSVCHFPGDHCWDIPPACTTTVLGRPDLRHSPICLINLA